jgi:hypothetical protein
MGDASIGEGRLGAMSTLNRRAKQPRNDNLRASRFPCRLLAGRRNFGKWPSMGWYDPLAQGE